MKLKKLLKQFKLINGEQPQASEEALTRVVRKLEHKQTELIAEIAAESDDEESELLVQELDIVRSQIHKGNKLLGQIRQEKQF